MHLILVKGDCEGTPQSVFAREHAERRVAQPQLAHQAAVSEEPKEARDRHLLRALGCSTGDRRRGEVVQLL